MPINVGDQIGDYEVLQALGAGGIGQVYRVRHSISNRIEAMKVLLPGRPGTEEIGERFLREIRVLAGLQHPNIAALHTAFRHHGDLVMIMEFVEGATLRSIIASGQLTIGQSLDYASQMLSGLAYAHSKSVVHRDIKPSNIMISEDGRVKLLDFGLAFKGRGSDLTRTGLIMGSIHYMSPEQVMGERVDTRSDIYSVGITLYQMLTGRLPIDGASEYAIASGHLRETPNSPSALNPQIPLPVSAMVLKALAKAQEERFQTAASFLDSLKTIVSLQSQETMTLITTSTTPEKATSPADPATKPTSTLSGASVLVNISAELAHYIGPIARVVVNRAAKKAATLDELYSMVSGEIQSDTGRRAFMATRQKYSV